MAKKENKQEIILKEEEQRGLNIFDVNPDNIAKNMITIATKTDVMTPEDKQFFVTNSDRWACVQQNCHTWRTTTEKRSILSEYPTTHLQFHQAILENKVFVDETVRLAKEAEMQKLEAEELYVDIENLKQEIIELEEKKLSPEGNITKLNYEIKKKDIELRRKTVELQEKAYHIQQSSIAMKYRVAELKDWKLFEDQMIDQMKNEGYSDEQIWDKDFGQKEGYFFHFLTKYSAVKASTDSGEVHNLTYLAKFSVSEAIKDKVFMQYLRRCNPVQLQSLEQLGIIRITLDSTRTKIDKVDVLVSIDPEDK